jgi:hypothetical protein
MTKNIQIILALRFGINLWQNCPLAMVENFSGYLMLEM